MLDGRASCLGIGLVQEALHILRDESGPREEASVGQPLRPPVADLAQFEVRDGAHFLLRRRPPLRLPARQIDVASDHQHRARGQEDGRQPNSQIPACLSMGRGLDASTRELTRAASAVTGVNYRCGGGIDTGSCRRGRRTQPGRLIHLFPNAEYSVYRRAGQGVPDARWRPRRYDFQSVRYGNQRNPWPVLIPAVH